MLPAKKSVEILSAEINSICCTCRKHYIEDSDDEEAEAGPSEPNPKLQQGNDLPRKYADFPLHLASTPICDIDPYYANQLTFMVVSSVSIV